MKRAAWAGPGDVVACIEAEPEAAGQSLERAVAVARPACTCATQVAPTTPPACSSPSCPQKRMRLAQLPPVLCLHLKRFKYIESMGRWVWDSLRSAGCVTGMDWRGLLRVAHEHTAPAGRSAVVALQQLVRVGSFKPGPVRLCKPCPCLQCLACRARLLCQTLPAQQAPDCLPPPSPAFSRFRMKKLMHRVTFPWELKMINTTADCPDAGARAGRPRWGLAHAGGRLNFSGALGRP